MFRVPWSRRSLSLGANGRQDGCRNKGVCLAMTTATTATTTTTTTTTTTATTTTKNTLLLLLLLQKQQRMSISSGGGGDDGCDDTAPGPGPGPAGRAKRRLPLPSPSPPAPHRRGSAPRGPAPVCATNRRDALAPAYCQYRKTTRRFCGISLAGSAPSESGPGRIRTQPARAQPSRWINSAPQWAPTPGQQVRGGMSPSL